MHSVTVLIDCSLNIFPSLLFPLHCEHPLPVASYHGPPARDVPSRIPSTHARARLFPSTTITTDTIRCSETLTTLHPLLAYPDVYVVPGRDWSAATTAEGQDALEDMQPSLLGLSLRLCNPDGALEKVGGVGGAFDPILRCFGGRMQTGQGLVRPRTSRPQPGAVAFNNRPPTISMRNPSSISSSEWRVWAACLRVLVQCADIQ